MLRRHFIINVNSDIPNNEIWYTEKYGKIVEPNDASSLPTIVSNTYSKGKGIIKFASDVTNIGNYSFRFKSYLTSITIPNSVTSIGDYAFGSCFYLTSIIIPNSVTNIGGYAFLDCSSLTSVIIPNNVTGIGDFAFGFCSDLTSVTIPNSVTSIGDFALNYCSSLTSINVDSNNPNYSSVDGVLFNKDKTTLITYPGGKQGAYTIPNSVTSIGGWAFERCSSLTSITISNSVTSIGESAFNDCSSLTSISYTGTIAQWRTIYKGDSWNRNVPATVVHCTDGDVEI